MIKSNEREKGDVTIVDISGRISLGQGADSLREITIDLVRRGRKKVILNLAETSYIDSSGIGELVSGFTRLANHGAELKLLVIGKRLKDLLKMIGLYTVFDMFEDENEAVRSFQ